MKFTLVATGGAGEWACSFRLDAPIGAAMWGALKPALALEQRLAMMELVDTAAASMHPANNAALAYVVEPATVADLEARGVPLASADIWLRDAELIHALRDTKLDALNEYLARALQG